MSKRTIVSLSYLLVIVISILTGCNNREFEKKYESFKTSYLKVTEVLDLKDPFGSIEKLNQESIIEEMNIMKDIADQMEQEASSDSEKRIYNNVATFYSGLEYLQYAAQKKEELTEDERGRLDSELTSAVVRRKSIIQGEL